MLAQYSTSHWALFSPWFKKIKNFDSLEDLRFADMENAWSDIFAMAEENFEIQWYQMSQICPFQKFQRVRLSLWFKEILKSCGLKCPRFAPVRTYRELGFHHG